MRDLYRNRKDIQFPNYGVYAGADGDSLGPAIDRAFNFGKPQAAARKFHWHRAVEHAANPIRDGQAKAATV